MVYNYKGKVIKKQKKINRDKLNFRLKIFKLQKLGIKKFTLFLYEGNKFRLNLGYFKIDNKGNKIVFLKLKKIYKYGPIFRTVKFSKLLLRTNSLLMELFGSLNEFVKFKNFMIKKNNNIKDEYKK